VSPFIGKFSKLASHFAMAGMTLLAQTPDMKPLPAEYQGLTKLTTDKDRIALAWKAAKDTRLASTDKFRLFLELTLEMQEKGPFIWEQMKSEPNWDSTMTLLVREDGIASSDYPFLKSWFKKHCQLQLLERLKSLGYYKADGVTPSKRKFSEQDKRQILKYSLELYGSGLSAQESTNDPH